jgi:hypothetical protein
MLSARWQSVLEMLFGNSSTLLISPRCLVTQYLPVRIRRFCEDDPTIA